MAISASIYLTPPYIAVSQTPSIYSIYLSPSEQRLGFGYIAQTNTSTTGFIAGDRILYRQSDENPVFVYESKQYALVDESDIRLKEDLTAPM